jgi:hypothetical protein
MDTTPQSWIVIDIAASASLLIAWLCSAYLNSKPKHNRQPFETD